MQKVRVKAVSIKTGTNAKGDWTNTRITGDDGAVFGTFATGASNIKEGSLINLEPIIKGKNVNFEKYNILEEPSAEQLAQLKSEPKPQAQSRGDTPETRASIETQSAVKSGTELLCSGVIDLTHPLAIAILDWCLTKLGAEIVRIVKTTATAVKDTAIPEEGKIIPKINTAEVKFANIGELFTKCWTELKIARPKVMELVGLKNEAIIKPESFGEVWQKVVEYSEKLKKGG